MGVLKGVISCAVDRSVTMVKLKFVDIFQSRTTRKRVKCQREACTGNEIEKRRNEDKTMLVGGVTLKSPIDVQYMHSLSCHSQSTQPSLSPLPVFHLLSSSTVCIAYLITPITSILTPASLYFT